MAFDREAARQAGYSDEEINAYLEEERNKKKAPAQTSMAEVGEPPDSTTVVPQAGGGVAGGVTTAGLAVAPYVAPAAGALAAGYIGNKLYSNYAEKGIRAAQALADAKMASEQGIAQRAAARAAGGMPMPTGPVAPAAPAMAPAPTAGPVAPAGMPAAAPAQAAEASLLDKTSAMIRQLAANKVLQGVAKGGVGLAAMSPTSTGPAVPSTGRMKGMEINPVTGRPWTPEQIQQYEANPSMYDAQLGAPQFRR